jgi:arginine/lysine/ornithine decarboxylase
MTRDQAQAPILEGLKAYEKEGVTSFGVPGHKSGKGAPSDVKSLLGRYAFVGDATTQKGIDDRRMSKQVRQEAERLAAEAWGARHCFFSTNGTSLSNHVAMLTVAAPGDTVLVARNSHKSLIAAVIIGHVRAVFLEPDYDEAWDIEHGIPAAELERQLAAHPDAKGVFVVSPTYYGISSDLRRLARICHRNKVPLVVDQAWGPHYPFQPEMPPPAIQCGADVAVASIHKTMAGLEQASILLLNSRLVPRDRFELCYDLFESTSPSVPILASIDATRRQFVQEGEKLIGGLLKNARWARAELDAVAGVRVMGREVLDGDARCALEDTKIFFEMSDLGVNGYEADDWLEREQKLSMGLSDNRHLLAGFTVGNDSRSTRKLVSGVKALAAWAKEGGKDRKGPVKDLPRIRELRTEQVLTPSEAFFAPAKHVPLRKATGRVAAEMVSPYPPGIPRVLPGERITAAHVQYFEAGLRAGFFVMDPSDMTLRTLRVVA